MGLVNELKRRNVIRVAIAYAAVAWLVLQVAALILDAYEAPMWMIKTITSIIIAGFPISLLLAWIFELTPDGLKRDSQSDHTAHAAVFADRRFNIIIIGMLIAAVVFLAIDNYVLERPSRAITDGAKSIAVLPFVNISSDMEQEYFSDGITEEILNALAKVGQLKVAGRTSSFAFKGKNEDLRLIGDTLGVAYVLQGSVRKSGDKVRITAQLIKVADGFHLWSETYDRQLTDIFAIQDDIAGEILKQLKTRLLESEQKVLAVTPTTSEAYSMYLLAKQQIYARRQATIESAADLLDQVMLIDPEYAPAWAQRGIAELLLADGNYGTLPVAQVLSNSKRFLDQALALDQDLAEGWAGLGLYHLTQQNEYTRAVAALEKSLAINPSLIDTSQWLKNALNLSGDIAKARRIAEQVATRDPLYRPGFTSAVLSFNRFGELHSSLTLINKVKRLLPGDPAVLWAEGVTHFADNRVAAAYPLIERALEIEPRNAVTRYSFSEMLLATYQLERLASAGYNDLQIVALDHLGQHERAGELALGLAGDGNLLPLFAHYNRTAQHVQVIRYINGNWDTLTEFVRAYPANVDGYQLMAEIALAYRNTNATESFTQALQLVAAATAKPAELGVNNFTFHRNHAIYFALAKDIDSALTSLERALEVGYRDTFPLADAQAAFATLASEPRFIALEHRMREHIERDREALELSPLAFD